MNQVNKRSIKKNMFLLGSVMKDDDDDVMTVMQLR